MADFPNILKPTEVDRKFVKVQNRSKFENGAVQSAAKHTRGRKKFSLQWNSLSLHDLELLLDHFDNNVGSSFECDNSMLREMSNLEGSTRVIYSNDEIEYRSASEGFYNVSVDLEEK